MSYCVNCGVKLEESLVRCPLCNTPVMNPNLLDKEKPESPFPKEKGHIEPIKNKDVIWLYSLVLIALSASCVLLNIFIYDSTAWSLYILGACIVLWVLAMPIFLYTNQPIYVSLLLDGLAVTLFLYLISIDSPGNGWFIELGLPITVSATVIAILVAFLQRRISSSILASALYVATGLSIQCICVELLIHWYLERTPYLTWSAIVLCAGVIIDVAIITTLSQKRLRNAVRKRLHF